MKHTAHMIKKPKLLYLGGAFLLYGTISIFIDGDYFGFKAFFFIVGIAWLLGSNMILKKARVELMDDGLKFFNQIGYQYRIIPFSNILESKLKEDEIYIRLTGGNSLELSQYVYDKNELDFIHHKLLEQKSLVA